MASPYWQKLTEGDVTGVVMPLDDKIRDLRREGLSLGQIGRRIGKRKSYAQQRLLRIAAREDFPTPPSTSGGGDG